MNAEEESSVPSATTASAEITVLVVDDELSNLTSLEKIFQREGMRVLRATNARDALEAARRYRVDVVLTDLMMPGTNGVELMRALKEVAPDTEVVLMTAYGTVETAVQAMREGAYDFVEKPLKRMQIVKSVRKAAERRVLVAENRSLRQELRLLTNREIMETQREGRTGHAAARHQEHVLRRQPQRLQRRRRDSRD